MRLTAGFQTHEVAAIVEAERDAAQLRDLREELVVVSEQS